MRGLGYSNARETFQAALRYVIDEYSILGPVLLNAADFGAATNRSRLFVVGIHTECGDGLTYEDFDALRRSPRDRKSCN